MKFKKYIKEQDNLKMQLEEPNSSISIAFNGREKLIKKYGNIEKYKGEFGSFRYLYRLNGIIIGAVQGVLKPPTLSNIYVKSEYRRKGIATGLFNAAKKDIKGLKVSNDKTKMGMEFFK